MMIRKKFEMKVTMAGTVGIVLLILAWALLVRPVSAQDQFAGNIKAIDSADPAATAKIVRTGYAGIVAGKPGDAVFVGDTVKTGPDTKVRIELSDASAVIIAPNSSLQIKGYLVEREQGTRNSVLRALKGTIRFVISRMFKPHAAGAEMKWKESSVVIEASNAVAGVRGTDFAAIIGQDESVIAVFDGAVSVRNAFSTMNGEVMVGANQLSSVKKGMAPGQPSDLGADRRDALEKATTMVNPRTAENSRNGATPKKSSKYLDKDVARDLQAGIALGDVLDKAVASGMPIEEVIPAALEAGVGPSALVYTAVVEGYSAKAVVTSAIEHGAPLNAVASAAVNAGANRKLVISGAIEAGVPPATIAAALSNGANGALLYGTPGPNESGPSPGIPAPPVSIGGGGGGTPSTKPASPYKP